MRLYGIDIGPDGAPFSAMVGTNRLRMRRPLLVLAISTLSLAFAASCKRPSANTANQVATANTQITASNPAAHEAEIKKLLTNLGQAMSKNDLAALDRMWAEDFTFVVHDGDILTKAQLLDLLRSGTEKFESVTFDDTNIRTYGGTAVVTAKGTQKATMEGKDHSGTATVSMVLVKTKEEGWRFVLVQLAELKLGT